jgi:hypothetical protein
LTERVGASEIGEERFEFRTLIPPPSGRGAGGKGIPLPPSLSGGRGLVRGRCAPYGSATHLPRDGYDIRTIKTLFGAGGTNVGGGKRADGKRERNLEFDEFQEGGMR